MVLTPSSTINLYRDVEINEEEQLVFSSSLTQSEYFSSHLAVSYVPCTIIRKTGALRVEVASAIIATCNYLSFTNPNWDNKTIYARIIDYNYINNECTEITYAIDYWQTWMFELQFDDMYIEREHLSKEDWDRANLNPYNPNILELRTPEDLPIGKDLEKLHYTIGDVNNDDGFMIGDALIQSSDYAVDNHIGVFLQIAMIDFEDLDTGVTTVTDRASYKFVQNILGPTINTDWGYFMLPKAMYDYLHGQYPNNPTVALEFGKGSGWYNDAQLQPNNSSNIKPGYISIFVESGAYAGSSTQPGIVSKLLDYLTRWNCVSALIGIYPVPNSLMVFSGMSYGSHGASIGVNIDTVKTHINVNHHKLMHFPYSYLRLVAPNGDVKELHFEEFANVQNGFDGCLFDVCMNLTEHPSLIAAPDEYKMTGISPTSGGMEPNITEALIFNQFPSLPYTTDAFLAQVAAVSAAEVANRTAEAGWKLAAEHTRVKNEGNMWSSGVLGTVGSIASSGLKAIGETFGLSFESETFGAQNRANLETQAIRENQFMQANAALAGSDNNAITQNLRLTRPAFAANEFHLNNGSGMINFDKMSFADIILMRVTLDDRILQIYDSYFRYYGYTSGRCGIPRVIQFMQGATADADVPHWETGRGSNRDFTYIKTMDCKVKHNMVPVTNIVKQMFDSGVRLLNGDEVIIPN